MEKSYNHLRPEERATVMLMMREGATVRSVASTLGRAPSTISRELQRNCPDGQRYEAAVAGDRAREKQHQRRRWPKLGPHTVLFGVVEYFLREGWSPEQIAGTLRNQYPDDLEKRVSHDRWSWRACPSSERKPAIVDARPDLFTSDGSSRNSATRQQYGRRVIDQTVGISKPRAAVARIMATKISTQWSFLEDCRTHIPIVQNSCSSCDRGHKRLAAPPERFDYGPPR